MEDGLISADSVADFETKLKVKLPEKYVGIPKPVFACLSFRYGGNRKDTQEPDSRLLKLMEAVLLELTKDEAYAIAKGTTLSTSRCDSIARNLSLPIEDVNAAIERYWFFWNEGLRLPRSTN